MISMNKLINNNPEVTNNKMLSIFLPSGAKNNYPSFACASFKYNILIFSITINP